MGATSRRNVTLSAAASGAAARLTDRTSFSNIGSLYLIDFYHDWTRYDIFLLTVGRDPSRDVKIVPGGTREFGGGNKKRAGNMVVGIRPHIDDADIRGSYHFGAHGFGQWHGGIARVPFPSKLDLVALFHTLALQHGHFERRGPWLGPRDGQTGAQPRRGQLPLPVHRTLLAGAGHIHHHRRCFGPADETRAVR